MYLKYVGCNVTSCEKKHFGRSYCLRHYQQIRTYGKILPRTIFDKNKFIDKGTHYEIELYNKDCSVVGVTLVSKSDKDILEKYKWNLTKRDGGKYPYITTRVNRKTVYLHHVLMGKKEGFEIDHINRNALDNRRENLHFVTHQKNCINRKLGGVSRDESRGFWRARITVFNKEIFLGRFKTKEEATKVRLKAQKLYFGI